MTYGDEVDNISACARYGQGIYWTCRTAWIVDIYNKHEYILQWVEGKLHHSAIKQAAIKNGFNWVMDMKVEEKPELVVHDFSSQSWIVFLVSQYNSKYFFSISTIS